MKRIRVLLVEDDPFWQENISSDLCKEEDIEVVGVASTMNDALDVIKNSPIDVILMDINLTEDHLDGIDLAREIKRLGMTSIKIIMLTSLNEKDIVLQSFKQGAVNYITKSSFLDMTTAIRDAFKNRASIHWDAAAIMRTEIILSDLTPMEREIYDLKQQGYNKTQISEMLYKSINTIKTQLRSIRDKLK
jgi:two-component system, NarL family, response regulator DevR